MKIKDFIKQEIDIDVADNVTDDLYIAFCGSLELTDEGKKKFADVLEYDIEFENNIASDIAIVNIDFPDWKKRLRKAKEFFYAAAGYCACSDYDRWFVEQ